MAKSKKKIALILGHPDTESFCASLLDAYQQGAEASGAQVRRINVGDLTFDPVLHKGYKRIQRLEPDLKAAQKTIHWASHLVFAYPMWWGAMPGVLKGFIDRTILPGFGFQFDGETSYMWKGLLTGRSARLLITLDGPPLSIRLLFQDPAIHAMTGMTLEFCGVSPVRVSQFGSVKRATRARKLLWKIAARELGQKGI